MAEPKGAFYEQLGQNLARARRDRRLTQDRLAAAVDMSRTSITNIEKGRQIVPVHLLAKLAQTLNVSVADLLRDLEPKPVGENLQRELSSLTPEKREWAARILALPEAPSEDSDYATTLQPRPPKGRRVTARSSRRPSPSAGRNAG